ncbi:MAG: thioredoxin family protein [Candidatus Lokiarchaeota archaeon]|nr:thioredoxin family protein [Candidatus Lokiarchaeota archaeon]
MNKDLDLKWTDLVSPTMTPDDYLREFGEKIKYNYKVYEPKADILKEIKAILKIKNERLKIAALGADWCPDCHKNVPRMIKLIKRLITNDIELRILYGIMINALDNREEIIWHKTRSPPEAVNPKFELKAIPTFYFFNKNGEFLGQIIEHPKETIEEDTLKIIKENL